MELKNARITAEPYQQPLSSGAGAEMGISDCRVNRSIAGMAECMTEDIPCAYKLSYGGRRFCRHPLVKQIAESTIRQYDY